MAVLWAFVALVSIHIGGLHGVSGLQLNIPNTLDLISPAASLQSPNFLTLPRRNQKLLNPSVPISLPKVPLLAAKKSNKDTTETSEPHCVASIWSSTSEKKINESVNDSVPGVIKDMFQYVEITMGDLNSSITEVVKDLFKCSDVSLGGMLLPLLSMVDLQSILGNKGLPGMGSLPLPTDNLLELLSLQSSLPIDTGFLKSLPLSDSAGPISDSLLKGSGPIASNKELSNVVSGNGLPLPDIGNLLPSPLSGNKNEKNSKESDKSENPASIKKPASLDGSAISGKGMDGIKDMVKDLKFHATNIVIKNMATKMEGDFIDVTVDISADISGPPSLTGLAIQILGYQMDGVAKIKLSVAANDSICTKFISEEKSVEVQNMKMKLLDVIKNEEKIIPLPVSSLVSGLVTLKMDFLKEECPIDFPNPWCKNATVPDKQDLFKYTFKNCNFISESLVCAYCTEINYNDKSVPVAGGQAPKLPAGANVALEAHHHLVKAAITHTMKKVSIKINDTVFQIIAVKYKLSEVKLELFLQIDVKQNGVKTGEIKSKLVFSYRVMIDGRNHLSGNLSLLSSNHKLEPENNTKEFAKELPMTVMTLLNDDINHINLPSSLMSDSLKGSPVHVDAQGNLIASQ